MRGDDVHDTDGEGFQGVIKTTAAESTPWWPQRPSPPDGAPNVVVILLDDTGFAHLGCFGSDIETPNLDRLAAGGLRYNNFHTTALCSPTRAALLTGRNHHSVGMRFLSNVDTGFPNCRGAITSRAATLAEVLGGVGYSTFALGKWHLANMEDCSPAGPFDQWPLHRGFDRFYGFLGGATDQFSPELVVDNHPVDPPSGDAYHLSEDLIDQAIALIGSQRSMAAHRPFFTYVAFGATHSPHQAPPEYLAKYRGRYDEGWDEVRARWFDRQKQLGIVPPDCELSPRNPGVKAWAELGSDERTVFARMQEAFAAFLDHTDAQIGRLTSFLEQIGELDNTLIMVMSDNGASQEGGRNGTTNELSFFNRTHTPVEEMVDLVDRIGGPGLYNNYPTGWSQVGNTPLRFYKQNTYEGGIRDPLIVHWPARVAQGGSIRQQYHHVTDVLPTILECVGIEAPQDFKGVSQIPVEGISFAYTFGAEASSEQGRRTSQYYEMLGHRAIWADGWKAVTYHQQGQPFEEDRWALYHTATDFAECHDLADAEPEQLRQLVDRWWAEAERHGVLPLDDRGVELFVLRRPQAGSQDQSSHRFLPGMPHLERFVAPDVRNRNFRITARIERSTPDDDGVLVALGASTGGYVLYVRDGRPVYEYNHLGHRTVVAADQPLPVGAAEVELRFDKTDEHRGRASLVVDGSVVGSGDVATMPWRQSIYGMDVGRDLGPTVSDAYEGPFPFTGVLHEVVFHLGDRAPATAADGQAELDAAMAEQ